jgi:uncharacterized protein HemY
MDPLPITEQFHIEAAKGWVLLGDREEAHKELDQIGRRWRKHPEVLELRWYLHAEDQDWEEALPIARLLHDHYPERIFGWLAHAHALLKGIGDPEAAWNTLLPAAEMFEGPQVAYGLACYASLAGRFDDARYWLERATNVAGSDEFKDSASEPIDLETLREFIEKF